MAFSVRVAVFAAVAFTLSTTAVIAFGSAAFFARTAFEAPAWADEASWVSPVAAARAAGHARRLAPVGAERLRLEGHTSDVRSAAFSPDGASVVTGSQDRTARIWSTNAADCPAGSLRVEVGGTSIISPSIADGQMQTVACPKAGEVQLLCTTREVTELERTPDCGVGVEESSSRLLMLMAHILTFAVFGFWDR